MTAGQILAAIAGRPDSDHVLLRGEVDNPEIVVSSTAELPKPFAGFPPVRIAYKWKEIVDLPQEQSAFRDRELEALSEAWEKQRDSLEQTQVIAQFNRELRRQWAIETGVIEGAYTIDRGTTETLIVHGLDARYIPHEATNRDPELVARIIQAHADVLDGLFVFVKGERPLGTSYIKELHAALMKYQNTITVFDEAGNAFETELRKGDYKTLRNNPSREDGSVHEYCPPEHVSSEMDRLVALHAKHTEAGIRPQIEAAWLHHSFTQIHPFQDGNGRVARALASLVLIKAGLFPLLVTREDRVRYISALEQADAGNLEPLIKEFSTLQKTLLTKAIGLAADVTPTANVNEVIYVTRDLLVALGRIVPKPWMAAKEHAGKLGGKTLNFLAAVAAKLTGELSAVNPGFRFSTNQVELPEAQLKSMFQELRYDPDLSQFNLGFRLMLTAPSGTNGVIVIAFHGLGAKFQGVLAASAYFQLESKQPAAPSEPKKPTALMDDVFRISFEDALNELEGRFTKWLETCVMNGITCWRHTLM